MLFFILICYGLTSILIYGKIFDKIRPKNIFFHCSLCMGFHSGWVVYLALYYINYYVDYPSFALLFCYACLSAGTTYILDRLVGDEGLRIKK